MPAPLRRLPSSVSLPERAAADLEFIRGAMERSGSFTAVPGLGGVAMGLQRGLGVFISRLKRRQA